MTSENELKDKQIAEKLGWVSEFRPDSVESPDFESWWKGELLMWFPPSLPTFFTDLNHTWKFVVPEMNPCEVGCIVTYVLAFKKDKSPESIATEICKSFMESKGGGK